MNTPMKAVAVFDRWGTEGLAEKLIDNNTLDCHVVSVDEFIFDIAQFDHALQRFGGSSLDLVLLDAALPAAFLTKMIARVQSTVPGVPVVLLPQRKTQPALAPSIAETLLVPNNLAHKSTHKSTEAGATPSVASAVRYLHDREQLQRKLLQVAFKDDLTGMHNRRGFRQLAKQQLRLARDTKQQLLLFFADLDGLKQINDTLGHRTGDQALKLAANTFKKTFRKGDVTARIGGDEFVALVMEEPGRNSDQIRDRLLGNLQKYAGKESRYLLSLSVGVAHIDPKAGVPLNALLTRLMAQADDAMYLQKRKTKSVAHSSVALPSAKPSSPIIINAGL